MALTGYNLLEMNLCIYRLYIGMGRHKIGSFIAQVER